MIFVQTTRRPKISHRALLSLRIQVCTPPAYHLANDGEMYSRMRLVTFGHPNPFENTKSVNISAPAIGCRNLPLLPRCRLYGVVYDLALRPMPIPPSRDGGELRGQSVFLPPPCVELHDTRVIRKTTRPLGGGVIHQFFF